MRGNTSKPSQSTDSHYCPNLGYIGSSQVEVANYLFKKPLKNENPLAYQHAKKFTDYIFKKNVELHFKNSKKLTSFLKKRDLTFSKKLRNGSYKTFSVPCTTSVVPLQKSVFNQVERAAQTLIVSLRMVLQDIYGSKKIEDSMFVNFLPKEERKTFIKAIKSSHHYFPQLHGEEMRNYPFFDNVGLDLVLVEDYLNYLENLNTATTFDPIKFNNLPFKILEFNAGSPSGASNNMNVLEGLDQTDKDILGSFDRVMPNDHFQVLKKTYQSLGLNWTGVKEGVQILLAPGGQNGAAPEIHQLASYSGLIYTDPVQLYQDNNGYIRLRTVSGSNPIVNAIYSRVNSESALYNPTQDIYLRDNESGKKLYLRDFLRTNYKGEGKIVRDIHGNPVPLESAFTVPGALEAIKNRKLYMGGLNRVLDNKIILPILCYYAPKFFEQELAEKGLSLKGPMILPPRTLPSKKTSLDEIKKDPSNWVIKAPDQAGGCGVYILKTLSKYEQNKIIKEAAKNPTEYAYQELVKIGRIPVASYSKQDQYKFSNLAADIRLWVFYGADKDSLPTLTHNALVRFAPKEKGPMSSIVNTSMGGGYAPFLIVDDTDSDQSISIQELVKPLTPARYSSCLPSFVAAQMIQTSKLIRDISDELNKNIKEIDTYFIYGTLLGLKTQLKEILAFLDPKSMVHIYTMIDIVSKSIPKAAVSDYFSHLKTIRVKVISQLYKLKNTSTIEKVFPIMEKISCLSTQRDYQTPKLENLLESTWQTCELKDLIENDNFTVEETKTLKLVLKYTQDLIKLSFPNFHLSPMQIDQCLFHLNSFLMRTQERLLASGKGEDFAKIFNLNSVQENLSFNTLYLGEDSFNRDTLIASQKEYSIKKRLIETDFIGENLQKARQDWLSILKRSDEIKTTKAKETFIHQQRCEHFKKHAFLNRYQELVDQKFTSVEDIIELLPILPYAHYNILQFAKLQNLTVEELFTSHLEHNRIALLDQKELLKNNIDGSNYHGECFARKKMSHGLFSESDIFIWVRNDIDLFSLIYTVGHELIHYQQIREAMTMEKNSIRTSSMAFANFLNYYGNFLGLSSRNLEQINCLTRNNRRPLYGYDLFTFPNNRLKLLNHLKKSLVKNDVSWNTLLKNLGSLIGMILPTTPAVKAKALQEILPAIENAKNIRFAKELGLNISFDEVASALPTANAYQREVYAKDVENLIESTERECESLRIVANHQVNGVYFPYKEKECESLTLGRALTPIFLGSSYNQTQQ